MLAVEIFWIVHEEVANVCDRLPFRNRRETKLVTKRHRDAGNQSGRNFVPAITRQKDGYLMPQLHQGFRQRLHHVGQATALGIRQPFGSYKQNFHAASVECKTVTERFRFVKCAGACAPARGWIYCVFGGAIVEFVSTWNFL